MSERELFIAALQISEPAERAAWLDRECGDDVALRQRIDELLRAFDHAGSLLENPAVPVGRTIDEPVTEAAGAVIGPYKLLEQIGEGGFGVVFMAEQTEPIRRKVALKVLKPGMDTRQVIARFEAERQALAIMDHPNIARVIDGGTTLSGRPFFVMELVRGVPITQFCDENRLTPRGRLELFTAICQAVQHAHQKGIIHRDLKPSNLLVTLHDDRAVVKVIDFGIAKATGERLTERTLFTNFAQMIGTPQYMSPEQAQMSGLDIDTRSDIYSLGVLLYELLTGTTPFEKERLRTAGLDEIRRIIREEEPPRPSTRISTLGQAATTVSNQRQCDPRKLSRLVRGELDWIVMKCLEKDRNRRYESASSLARDIERYLRDEPVQACPPSTWYRFRKTARRHKLMLLTTAAAFVVLVVLVVGLSVGIWLVSSEQERTEKALADAKAQKAQAEANLAKADAERQRRLESFERTYAGAGPLLTLGHPALGDSTPDLEAVRRESLEQVLRYFQGYPLRPGDDPIDRYEAALVLERIASLHDRLGRPNQAVEAGRRSLEIAERLVAEFPAEPKYRHVLASSHSWIGYFLWQTQNRPREAEPHLRWCIQYWESLDAIVADLGSRSPWQPINDAGRAEVLASLHYGLGQLLRALPGRRADAVEHLQQAVSHWEKLLPASRMVPDDSAPLLRHVNVLHELGYQSWDLGRVSEAEQVLRQALHGADRLAARWPEDLRHPYWQARVLNSLGLLLRLDGRPQEAANLHGRALEIIKTHSAEDFEGLRGEKSRALFHRGLALCRLEQREAALADTRAYIALWKEVKRPKGDAPDDNGSLANAHHSLGRMLELNGSTQEAEETYRTALQYAEKQVADFPDEFRGHHARISVHFSLASLLAATDRPGEAEALYRRIHDWTPSSSEGCNDLAWRLATGPQPRWRDPLRALELAKKATELGPEHGIHWNTLGVAQYRTGDCKGAIGSLQKSQQLLSGNHAGFNLFFLAMAHWQLGNKEEARNWYDQAVQWMEKHMPKDEELRRFRAEAKELMQMKSEVRNQESDKKPD